MGSTNGGRLLALLVAVISCRGLAGAEAIVEEPGDISASWQKGESRNYTITAASMVSAPFAGSDSQENSVSYRVTISVIERSRDHYLLEWVYHDIAFKGKNSHRLDQCLTEGLKIRYSTDTHGRFVRIENWREISNLLDKSLRPISESASDRYLGPPVQQVLCPFESPDQMETDGIEDIRLFHSMHGYRRQGGESFVFRQNVWNPIQEAPFVTFATPRLTRVDDQTVHVEYSAEIAPAGNNLFRTILDGELIYESESGWPKLAYWERIALRGEMSQKETIEIRLAD